MNKVVSLIVSLILGTTCLIQTISLGNNWTLLTIEGAVGRSIILCFTIVAIIIHEVICYDKI